MALSISKKPYAIIAIFLMILHGVNSANVVNFLFNKFDQSNAQNLIIQGDASVSSNGALQLTKVNNGVPQGGSVGRALYTEPITLYNSSTGEVSSIYTFFEFLISSPSNNLADGLAFFLASPDTTIPPNSGGAYLGLFSASNALNNTRKELIGFKSASEKVVAVEFDTYPNLNIGDPNYKHIGIDVNSIKSVVTREWEFQNGESMAATIFYDGNAKNLRVFASYPNGYNVDFNYDIDLTTVLPEQVRVGFSGATGQYAQINNILSWSFGSILGKTFNVGKGGIASVV